MTEDASEGGRGSVDDHGNLLKALLSNAKDKQQLAVAVKLIEKYHFKTIAGKRSETVYAYYDGYYHPDGEVIIKKEVEADLQKAANSHVINEIIARIKRRTFTDRDAFNPPPHLLNVKNGILDMMTGVLVPHSPDQLFLQQLPVSYVPEAVCVEIKKFWNQILTEDDIKLHEEIIGSCLYRRPLHKKAFLGVGVVDTGKTTDATLITRFLGEPNVSGESLQKITGDRFSTINLYGKLANIADDLSYEDINNAGGFKVATGGGFLPAEEKFGDRFQFINSAKLFFFCNQIPRLKDSKDMAYYDRWLITRYANVITEKDGFIIDKLTTEQEMNGLLNLALEGLRRVLKQGHFSYPLTAEQNQAIMLRNSEPMRAFAEDCLMQADGKHVPKDVLYEAYKWHARKNKLAILTKTALTQGLQTAASYITSGQRKINGKMTECYLNVLLNGSNKDFKDFILYLGNKSNNYSNEEFVKTPESTDATASIPLWDEKNVVLLPCVILDCKEDRCNFDTDGKPRCRTHLGQVTLPSEENIGEEPQADAAAEEFGKRIVHGHGCVTCGAMPAAIHPNNNPYCEKHFAEV